MADVLVSRIESPLGRLVAGATPDGICLLEFTGPKKLAAQLAALRRRFRAAVGSGRNLHIDRLERQLTEYFAGSRRRFDVPLVTPGTPFQRRVWKELTRIPYGETRTYGDLARRLGVPSAFRAVGHANGSNPISILLPCHRLVGKDGSLTGYGGGVWRKKKLLELEVASAQRKPARPGTSIAPSCPGGNMSTKLIKRTLLGAVLVGGVAVMAPAQIPLPPLPPGLNVRITTGRPPAARREVRVARPGPDYVWVNGYWHDDGGGWAWIPGRWERPVEAQAYWIPARYIRTSRGTIYEPAHWSNQQVVVDDDVARRREWRQHERMHRQELERERNRDYYRDDRDQYRDHR